MTPLMPRRPVPDLTVPLAGGGSWSLGQRRPEHFSMLVFYRGLHCPICATYLRDLNRKAGDFAERGADVLVLSTDDEARAVRAKTEWELDRLDVGYGIGVEAARGWGLYISSSRGMTSMGVEEPTLFNEPGLFLIRPDGTLYAATTASMPFARPNFAEVLKAIDFVVAKDYPARGEA